MRTLAFVIMYLTSSPTLGLYQLSISSSPIKVILPVRWDVTRTSVNNQNAATESETFSEEWVIFRSPPLGTYLQSPRARVRVHNFGEPDKLSNLPAGIVIGELELAELLGLNPREDQGSAPLIIELTSILGTNTISFSSESQDHVSAINMSISAAR